MIALIALVFQRPSLDCAMGKQLITAKARKCSSKQEY